MSAKYEEGQKVDLVILRETNLGFVARVNETDEGLIYHSEIFEHLEPGYKVPGYVKKVREDGRLDLLLQPFGNFGTKDLSDLILHVLKREGGFLPIDDKTSPEEIYRLFGVSKKKYKMALGNLYKQRLITIHEDGIRTAK